MDACLTRHIFTSGQARIIIIIIIVVYQNTNFPTPWELVFFPLLNRKNSNV